MPQPSMDLGIPKKEKAFKILEVSSRKYGYWNREYVYKIQKNKWGTIRYEWAEGGIIIEDVYESQLTEYNG